MDRQRVLDKFRSTYSKTAGVAEEHGWKIEHNLVETENYARLELKAVRGNESISIWWEDGRLIEAPIYHFGGGDTKLRNHSAMLQQMGKQPDLARSKRKAKAASRRVGGGIELLDLVRSMPWEPENLDDRELLRACYGKTLVWLNKLTGLPEQDQIWFGYWTDNRRSVFVPDPQSGPNWNKTNYKITVSSTGRRIINFVGVTGYRSVGIDALLQVL